MKPPWCEFHLSLRGPWDVSPLCSFLIICASLQRWCPDLGKGCGLNEMSLNCGPNIWTHFPHVNVDAGWVELEMSYPKCCELAKRWWELGPLTLPGLWGTSIEALSTTWKQPAWASAQGHLRQSCLCLQKAEANENCHWSYLTSRRKTNEQKNHWFSFLLCNYAFLLNAGDCLVSYKSTGHGLGRPKFSYTTFWASVSLSGMWG